MARSTQGNFKELQSCWNQNGLLLRMQWQRQRCCQRPLSSCLPGDACLTSLQEVQCSAVVWEALMEPSSYLSKLCQQRWDTSTTALCCPSLVWNPCCVCLVMPSLSIISVSVLCLLVSLWASLSAQAQLFLWGHQKSLFPLYILFCCRFPFFPLCSSTCVSLLAILLYPLHHHLLNLLVISRCSITAADQAEFCPHSRTFITLHLFLVLLPHLQAKNWYY